MSAAFRPDRIRGFWLLARPNNLAIAFPAILVGGIVSGVDLKWMPLLLAAVSGVCMGAGANAINDYYDLEIDRINKPNRPLPAGLLTRRDARIFATAAFLAGIAVAAFINRACFSVALVSAVLLVLYSRSLKKTVLLGNLTVAFMLGLALVYGGLAVGGIRNAAVVGLFSFLYNLAREVLKDADDMEGDRTQGADTFPIRYGIRASLVLVTVVLLLLVAATFLPYGLGWFSRTYLWIVAVGVDAAVFGFIISMWRKPQPGHLGRIAVWMKADMLAGLAAVFFGGNP
ncbi:MAG: geranylgeranylglycerol-phosphate geranylgeranyltransferase [bacterium]|nr:geranylgeranylglycerol-phosphate geranylgeranyltransferase [bacterium]